MWMMVLRVAVVLTGLVGASIAGLVTTLVSLNPPASNTLMALVFLIMAVQAVVSIGLIVFGIYRPIREWLAERAAQH